MIHEGPARRGPRCEPGVVIGIDQNLLDELERRAASHDA
jgi:hypothetical protein